MAARHWRLHWPIGASWRKPKPLAGSPCTPEPSQRRHAGRQHACAAGSSGGRHRAGIAPRLGTPDNRRHPGRLRPEARWGVVKPCAIVVRVRQCWPAALSWLSGVTTRVHLFHLAQAPSAPLGQHAVLLQERQLLRPKGRPDAHALLLRSGRPAIPPPSPATSNLARGFSPGGGFRLWMLGSPRPATRRPLPVFGTGVGIWSWWTGLMASPCSCQRSRARSISILTTTRYLQRAARTRHHGPLFNCACAAANGLAGQPESEPGASAPIPRRS